MHDRKGLITQTLVENRIFTLRGMQVMIDSDLAKLYGIETKALNQSVKGNQSRFPKSFHFRLTNNERDELVTNCDRFKNMKHSSSLPYAFTEQGVAMLSAVLRSETAVKVSIQIMQAFVQMRKIISDHSGIFPRLNGLEYKQTETARKFEIIFDALQQKESEPTQGIFYNGQIFDAYKFISDIIRKAQTSILLIDNYIDDTVLTLFCKRRQNVTVTIYTNKMSKQLALDIQKFNAQYEPIIAEEFKDAHDRFLMTDDKDLYHIGTSLKDLGKKWFAFSKMDASLIDKLKLKNR